MLDVELAFGYHAREVLFLVIRLGERYQISRVVVSKLTLQYGWYIYNCEVEASQILACRLHMYRLVVC